MVSQASVKDHRTTEELEAGLEHIRQSPTKGGPLLMIVRRPDVDERELPEEGALDVDVGLVGDNWKARGSTRTPDGKANPEAQITIMNSRLLTLVAGSEERWPLAGDQLVIDMDLSMANLPPGTRLSIGSAVVEITAKPHTGMREVRRPLRQGRAEVHKHPPGEGPEAARGQHEGGPVGDDSRRRHGGGGFVVGTFRSACLAEGYRQAQATVGSRPGPLCGAPSDDPRYPSGGDDERDPVAPGPGNLRVDHEVLELLGL